MLAELMNDDPCSVSAGMRFLSQKLLTCEFKAQEDAAAVGFPITLSISRHPADTHPDN